MSKGNLFLGFGRGKLGDIVMYRQDGEQITRARNRSPRNPQTAIQLLQRVCLKTTSSAYSLMQEITNHSFQGLAEGTQSQSRFNKLNIERFRNLLADEINSGDADVILSSSESNFAMRGTTAVELNPYIVSEGTMRRVPIQWMAGAAIPAFGIACDLGSANPTYSSVLGALGLVSGDQLTFVALSIDDRSEGGQCNSFDYARIILEPASGDLSEAFLSGSGVNDPNLKNKGDVTLAVQDVDGAFYLTFRLSSMSSGAQVEYAIAAATCITSHYNGSVWQRSTQSLVVRPDITSVTGHLWFDHSTDYLGDAISSYMTDESSLLYLNQAGGGGASGSVTQAARITAVGWTNYNILRGASANLSSLPPFITASMSGGDGANTYKLAIRAAGASTSLAETTFTSSSATIQSPALVSGTTYSIVLLENDSVVDTYCQITYSTYVSEAVISSVTFNGSSVARNGTGESTSLSNSLSASMSNGGEGHTYALAIMSGGNTLKSSVFSDGSATISDPVSGSVCLLEDGNVVDTYCTLSIVDID